MPRTSYQRPFSGLVLLIFCWVARAAHAGAFVNFETPPIHPLALNSDNSMLAACNLQDNRVEIFRITAQGLLFWKSLPVGLDPVSARFRKTNELWVVNHISRSISIVDLTVPAVVATLDTLNSPEDVIFTRDAKTAFVSCSKPNRLQPFNAETRAALQEIAIEGDRPKSMAISPDGSKIFVAIFESGNATTILGRRMTHLDQPPAPTAVDFARGPHAGQNPPPNSSHLFSPPIRTDLVGSPPRVGLIVRKRAGKWMDDNKGDWTEYVSGPKAALTERFPGWDMPDHDIAIVDVATRQVSYISGLMNICMDLAVNPVSGTVALVGTDAINEVRFEPALKGVFARVQLALVDQTNSVVRDLNPHLDYKQSAVPRSVRNLSIGDPRGVIWNNQGTRLYVTGMGSRNIAMLGSNGNRLATLALPEGPVGLAFDATHNLLYVQSRFESGISILNPDKLELISTIPFFDPTPRLVRMGRKHLYDTHKTSGLGQGSCGFCHVDARLDRLAWDLGTPAGTMKLIVGTNRNLTAPGVTNHFHPMKGPMVTQTLQDIITHEPFHWRGDRDGIEEFNSTFHELQAADFQLTPQEMTEFKEFLKSITFPPNPVRNFDNSLPTTVPLPGHFSLGRGNLFSGQQLPPGNPRNGLAFFNSSATNGCVLCHTMPTGLGPDALFVSGRWRNIPPGTNQAHNTALIALERTSKLPFKIAQLRSIPDKIGFDLASENSRAGFGFLHDGVVDSLVRFLQDGFDLRSDQQTADLIAFLLAFTGSDLSSPGFTDPNRAPGVSSQDVPASVGRQFTLTNSVAPSLLASAATLALDPNKRVELVAKWFDGERVRGFWLDPSTNRFRADRRGEMKSLDDLKVGASVARPVSFTVVPAGTGIRIGIDRDLDGFFDQDELDAGSDPADSLSVPGNKGPIIQGASSREVFAGDTFDLPIPVVDPEGTPLIFAAGSSSPPGLTVTASGSLEWRPSPELPAGFYTLTVYVSDQGTPPLTNEFNLNVELKKLSLEVRLVLQDGLLSPELNWESIPGRQYVIQQKRDFRGAPWQDTGGPITATAAKASWRITPQARATFYRIQLVP